MTEFQRGIQAATNKLIAEAEALDNMAEAFEALSGNTDIAKGSRAAAVITRKLANTIAAIEDPLKTENSTQ